MTPDLITAYLDEILACACDALENGVCGSQPTSLCGCPCRKFVSWGPAPTDMEACCSDGQLSVWLERVYPYSKFPSQSNNAAVCNQPLAMDIAVQLWRCFPSMKDDGSAPRPAEIEAATEALTRDLYLLTWGIICCLSAYGKRLEFVFGGSRPLDPQGGCAGIELKFTIQLLDPKPVLA